MGTTGLLETPVMATDDLSDAVGQAVTDPPDQLRIPQRSKKTRQSQLTSGVMPQRAIAYNILI